MKKILNNLGISQIRVNRTLKNPKGDITVSISGDWLSDKDFLSCGSETQVAYLLLAMQVDIAAIRSQLAKGYMRESSAQEEIARLQQQYEKQIQEVTNE